jgi:predicted transcriptional regulator
MLRGSAVAADSPNTATGLAGNARGKDDRMTMNLSGDELLAGEPILQVRDVVRKAWNANRAYVTRQDFIEAGRPVAQAARILGEMGERGFIGKRNRDKTFPLTPLGEKFARAKGTPRIKRSTAETALVGLLDRVAEINLSDDYLYSVTHVAIFGSVLGAADILGDLDVAVRLRQKREITQAARNAHTKATAPNRHFSGPFEWSSWPINQIHRKLRNKKRAIGLILWKEFETMVKKKRAKYKVIFGDPTTVFKKDPWASLS